MLERNRVSGRHGDVACPAYGAQFVNCNVCLAGGVVGRGNVITLLSFRLLHLFRQAYIVQFRHALSLLNVFSTFTDLQSYDSVKTIHYSSFQHNQILFQYYYMFQSVKTLILPPLEQTLTFKPRIKSHLLFAGIIRSSSFSPRQQDKG